MCLLAARTSWLHTEHMTLSKWQRHKHLWNIGAVNGISLLAIPILQRNFKCYDYKLHFLKDPQVFKHYNVGKYFVASLKLSWTLCNLHLQKALYIFGKYNDYVRTLRSNFLAYKRKGTKVMVVRGGSQCYAINALLGPSAKALNCQQTGYSKFSVLTNTNMFGLGSGLSGVCSGDPWSLLLPQVFSSTVCHLRICRK